MKNRKYYGVVMFAVIIIVLLLLSSCAEETTWDSPVDGDDKSGAVVIWMPDQFRNVAFKCYGVNGIYSTRGYNIEIIPNDPNCPVGMDFEERAQR